MDVYNDEFLALINAFNKFEVQYILVGGFSTNLHGYKRATGDIDFWLKDTIENRENLINAFEYLGIGRFEELKSVPFLAGYCEILLDSGVYCDLMDRILGFEKEDFDTCYQQAEQIEIDQTIIRFLHFNHLLHSKENSTRLKDKLDAEELKKIRNSQMNIPTETNNKTRVFEEIGELLEAKGFQVVSSDQNRPWGGFFVIDESQTEQFVDMFFETERDEIAVGKQKLSPKILLVEPQKRLSWQYHHRRTEIWKVIRNTAGVVISETDEQTEVQEKVVGDVIRLGKEQRHRLVGLDKWGIIAEIWQHSDPENPSDENDIVRVEDDFGR